MTATMMTLRALVEKTPDADLLREMIGVAAERLMEFEVGAATGAGYGEKNPLRLGRATACPGPDPGATATGVRRTRNRGWTRDFPPNASGSLAT